MANYNSQVAKNKQDADKANATMDALKTNLAANGQTVVSQSKTFNAGDLEKDKASIQILTVLPSNDIRMVQFL